MATESAEPTPVTKLDERRNWGSMNRGPRVRFGPRAGDTKIRQENEAWSVRVASEYPTTVAATVALCLVSQQLFTKHYLAPCTSCKKHQNSWRMGFCPRPHWGSLQRFAVLLAGGQGARCLRPKHHPRFQPFGLRASFGPSASQLRAPNLLLNQAPPLRAWAQFACLRSHSHWHECEYEYEYELQ